MILDKLRADVLRHYEYYNINPRYIMIDSEINKQLKKETNNLYTDESKLTHILGMKIIEVIDLHAPCGKVDWILEGTRYR